MLLQTKKNRTLSFSKNNCLACWLPYWALLGKDEGVLLKKMVVSKNKTSTLRRDQDVMGIVKGKWVRKKIAQEFQKSTTRNPGQLLRACGIN